jgi:hypothetical protein
VLHVLLQSKLASLAAEAQTAQAAATSSFEWRGIKAPVSQERVRVPLHNAAELAASLEAAMDTGASALLLCLLACRSSNIGVLFISRFWLLVSVLSCQCCTPLGSFFTHAACYSAARCVPATTRFL